MSTQIPSWFDFPERRSMLSQVAKLWHGTPFFPNSCAIGPAGGVDCVNLLNAIYATTGCIDRQTIPRHSMDAAQHDRTGNPLIEAFETWPGLLTRFARLADLNPDGILPGDALCFTNGHRPFHGAVMLTAEEILHVIAPAGVHRMQLRAAVRGEKILGRLAAVFRPTP